MATNTQVLMPSKTPELEMYEQKWNTEEKIQVRATITKEAQDFLEEMAFKDFGMMKKGAVGIELTKLILIAKETLTKNE